MTLTVIFSGASLVLCGFFFIYFTFYIRRRTDRANILEDYRDEVNKLIADIDSATDRDITLVEDRITALKKLLEDVDKRIGVLSREEERRRGSSALYAGLGRQIKVTVRDPGPAAEPASVMPPAEEPAAPISPAPRIPPPTAVPVPSREKAAPASPGPKPKEPRASLAERVTELSRAGFAPDLIASRLEVSLSEVELAIAVSRSKYAAPDLGA